MATAKEDFERWFVESLAPLRANGHAGFVFVLVAFPLLERYLRGKSGCPEGRTLTPVFFSNLGIMLPAIAGKENSFWDCYRNGLLHQATFPKAKLDRKTGIWVALLDELADFLPSDVAPFGLNRQWRLHSPGSAITILTQKPKPRNRSGHPLLKPPVLCTRPWTNTSEGTP